MSNYLMRGFYSRLNADTGSSTNPVRTAVTDRIYAVEAPASSTLPLVVYSMDSVDTERFFSGIVRSTAIFTVTSFPRSKPDRTRRRISIGRSSILWISSR
jgi:hypothetical protein